MATFEAQVEGLTSLSIDGSSAPTQTELTQFLTDGAKEIINVLPEDLLNFCTSSVSFTSGSASTLNTGKISNVLRSDGDITQPCRDVPALYKGRYSDPDDMNYATVTDPIYYIENNSLDVLPAGGSVTYSEVQYPAVAYGDSAIAVFPDEAEYLVPLYASVKALQNALGAKSAYYTAMTDAVNAINTQADNAVSNVSDARTALGNANTRIATAKGEIDLAKIEAAEIASQTDNSGEIETALDAIKTELDKVDEVILLAHEEFDEVAAEVSSTATSPITAARSAVPSALSINDLTVSVSAPSAPSLATISYSDASNADASASSVGSVTVGSVNKADISGHAPAYNKPSLTSRVAFKAFYADTSNANPFGDNDPGDFSFTAVAPASPSNPTISYSNASVGNAVSAAQDAITQAVDSITHGPTDAAGTSDSDAPSDAGASTATASTASAYTSPSVTGGAGLTGMEAGTIADATDQIEFDTWWDTLGDMIETNEDIELANTQIGKVRAYIDAFQAEVQDASSAMQATIEDARQATQAAISNAKDATQISIKNAELDVQTNNASMQTQVQASIANASNDVNASISKMQQSTSASIAKMQQSTSAAVEQMRQSTNVNIQNASKTLDASIQDYSLEIQKYQADLSKYQQDITKDIQSYSQKLSRYTMEIDKVYTSWAKTESDTLQQYQLDITNELNEYNANNDIYQANIKAELAKHNSDLQKALTQAQVDAQDAQKEAELATDVSKFNKAQDQALALANAAKQIEDAIANNKSLIEKFIGEINKYSAQVNDEVQEYQANLRQKVEEFDSSIKLQGTYFQEAQARVNAGDAFLKQAEATLSQAQGYAAEATARASFTGAKSQAVQSYIATANTYLSEVSQDIALAQGYAGTAATYIQSSQAFANEAQVRLAVDSSYYGWIEKQQAKLQQDYDRGLQILIGAGNASQE